MRKLAWIVGVWTVGVLGCGGKITALPEDEFTRDSAVADVPEPVDTSDTTEPLPDVAPDTMDDVLPGESALPDTRPPPPAKPLPPGVPCSFSTGVFYAVLPFPGELMVNLIDVKVALCSNLTPLAALGYQCVGTTAAFRDGEVYVNCGTASDGVVIFKR